MSEAMGEMHFPQILIMTLDTMVRFLVILGRFMGRVLEAVGLRKVGKDNWKNAGTGGILGVTYLKAQQMEVHTEEAMACRCFEGTYRSYRKRKFGRRDAVTDRPLTGPGGSGSLHFSSTTCLVGR